MKHRSYRLIAAALACVLTLMAAQARSVRITSPQGQNTIEASDSQGHLTIAVSHGATDLLNPSAIGLHIEGLADAVKIKSATKQTSVARHITAPFYRQKEFDFAYNTSTLRLDNGMALELLASDQGVAYRWVTSAKSSLHTVAGEKASYRLAGQPDLTLTYTSTTNPDWDPLAIAFQNWHVTEPLSATESKPVFLPATADYGNELKMTILESDLESYPGMWLVPDPEKGQLNGLWAKLPAKTDCHTWRIQEYVTERDSVIARTQGARTYPWRVFAITTADTQMPVNDMVYALASPSRITSVDWIPTGKVAWDWWNDWGLQNVSFEAGINTRTYKYYIDFASRSGLEFVVLDEGWFDPKKGDMMTVIPQINLPELVEYARERGVKLVLWTIFNLLDDNLEAACKKYGEMGIAGFKVDFLDRDDQQAVDKTYRIAQACADHHLILDYHGIYKPTGLNRTYPNVLNFEGVSGMEEVKWTKPDVDMPRNDVTFPFIRMMAGNVDFTPGAMLNASKADYRPIYYHPMSMGTRCHQLATYIVYDSPFTMLCDTPSAYEREQECLDFIASLPVVFDHTRVVDAKMGEYLVTARSEDGSWFVGGLTNWTPREVTLNLDFLPQGHAFKATIMADGINADKTPTDYTRTQQTVTAESRPVIRMAAGGGFAIRLDPIPTPHGQVSAVPEPMRHKIPAFYQKYIHTDGLYIVSSANVSDQALELACDIVGHMLLKRPDIKQQMAGQGAHLMVIGRNEQTCDIPEYQHICTSDPDTIAFWNWRARGFGGAPEDDLSASCGEENLLALPSDKYDGENILVHEFAHLIHMLGIAQVEPDFNSRLEALWTAAKAKGLWHDTYALQDKEEYFAEAVQSFFNCNRYACPANGVHNHINRRSRLKTYDPDMYSLLKEYFYETELPILNNIHP